MRKHWWIVGLIALVALSVVGSPVLAGEPAAETDLEARVAALEKGRTGAGWAENLKLHGYVQPFGTVSEDDAIDDTFDVRRAFITLDARLNDKLKGRAQADAAASSDILRDAYLEYSFSRALKLRAGQFKIPLSAEQMTSASSLDTVHRATVSRRLAYGRDIGLMLRGAAADEALCWWAAVVNGAGRNSSDNNSEKDVVLRAEVTPLGFLDCAKGLRIGCSGQMGKRVLDSDAEGRRTRVGPYASFEHCRLRLVVEGIWEEQQLGGGVDRHGQGGYVTAVCPLGLGLEAVGKYDWFDPDRAVADDSVSTTTAGLTWHRGRQFKLQFNYRAIAETPGNANDEMVVQAQVRF